MKMKRKNRNVAWLLFGAVMLFLSLSTVGLSDTAGPSSPPARTITEGEGGDVARMTDIHDIKPLERIGYPFNYTRIIFWCVVAVILSALIVAAIRWFRKRARKGKCAPPPLPPHELAFQQLRALAAMKDPGCRDFYFDLSGILRGYLQGRYGLDALEMTTEELLPKISQLKLDRNLERGIKDFLNWSDPVKFAGITAERDKMKSDLAFAERFVRQSMPVEDDALTHKANSP